MPVAPDGRSSWWSSAPSPRRPPPLPPPRAGYPRTTRASRTRSTPRSPGTRCASPRARTRRRATARSSRSRSTAPGRSWWARARQSGAEPVIRNNIFYQNGSAALHRGRGICALGGPATVIRDNVFFGNYLAAILVKVVSAFQDLTAQEANDAIPDDGILENVDADPA